MSNVMMGLGDFRFEINAAAYQKLTRSQSYRWQQQDRIGRLPANQFVGPALITVDLDGAIYPAFRGGLGQVQTMRDLAGRGEALDLVDGSGKVWGLYVILDVSETEYHHHADGKPRRIDFSLRIAEYGDDQANGSAYLGGEFGEGG